MSDQLTVAINAQVGGNTGGRGQFVRSLVAGLGSIESPDTEYVVVTGPEYSDWPEQYADDTIRIVARPWTGAFERVKALMRPVVPHLKPVLLPILDRLRGDQSPSVPDGREFFDSLGADVVHFPYRNWQRVDAPMVYNLGDLQHLHYPEFFDEETLRWRDTFCPEGCRVADRVITASDFVKEDISEQYGIGRSKIQTIRRAAPTEFYTDHQSDEQDVTAQYGLPENFLLYPSKKWPHKNHLKLLTALSRIEAEYGEKVHLVCTGANEPEEQYDEIRTRVSRLGIEDRVHILGFVSESELLELYRTAQLVVFPTLFEGQGFPLVEAFEESTPIACSSIPPLREYAGDAAEFFDPESVTEIAATIHRLVTDDAARKELTTRSRRRGQSFNWMLTAETYQAVYRQVDGRTLTDRERSLLEGKGLLDRKLADQS
jgi:glycosyltransferase involved in cell wall biosynthesis